MMRNSRTYSFAVHLLAFLLAAEVVFLTHENRQLKESISSRNGPQLAIGDTLQFKDLVLAGSPNLLNEGGNRIVFILSTNCSQCKFALPIWNRVNERFRRIGLAVFGISVDSKANASEASAKVETGFPVIKPRDTQKFLKQNKISFVPLTLFVSEGWIVLRIWKGALGENDVVDLAQAISKKR